MKILIRITQPLTLLITLFILAITYTAVYLPISHSAYETGYNTGVIFRQILEIVAIFALSLVVFNHHFLKSR